MLKVSFPFFILLFRLKSLEKNHEHLVDSCSTKPIDTGKENMAAAETSSLEVADGQNTSS